MTSSQSLEDSIRQYRTFHSTGHTQCSASAVPRKLKERIHEFTFLRGKGSASPWIDSSHACCQAFLEGYLCAIMRVCHDNGVSNSLCLYGAYTSVITALPLQLLFFYGEGPAAIKLVDDRSPFESGELLHALIVESCHPRRIFLVLFKWI